jgi:hypothetical protein
MDVGCSNADIAGKKQLFTVLMFGKSRNIFVNMEIELFQTQGKIFKIIHLE